MRFLATTCAILAILVIPAAQAYNYGNHHQQGHYHHHHHGMHGMTTGMGSGPSGPRMHAGAVDKSRVGGQGVSSKPAD